MSHDQASLDLLRHVVDYFLDHGPDTYDPDVYEKLQALQTALKKKYVFVDLPVRSGPNLNGDEFPVIDDTYMRSWTQQGRVHRFWDPFDMLRRTDPTVQAAVDALRNVPFDPEPVVRDGAVYDDIPDRDDEDWGVYWVDRLGQGWVEDVDVMSPSPAFMTRQAAEDEAARHRDRTDVVVVAVPATVDVVQLGRELRVELADRAVSEAGQALQRCRRASAEARSRLHRP